MDRYVEKNGVRITAARDRIRVQAVARLPDRPLFVEIDLAGVRQTQGAWNPHGGGFTIVPPPGRDMDLTRCDVRVKDGPYVLAEWKGGGQYIVQQIGRMACIACADSRRFNPGQMWVGKNHLGHDEWITCPECRGTGEVPRVQYLDPDTGREIDYERQHEPPQLVS